MPVSIDNALRILRRRGWMIGSDSQGAWVVEQAVLDNTELADIADALKSKDRTPGLPLRP